MSIQILIIECFIPPFFLGNPSCNLTPALNITTLPGLTPRRMCAPINAIGTVLYSCEKIRFCINHALRISFAGWDREGCKPSLSEIDQNPGFLKKIQRS